jgi:hypothetical protein
LCRALRELHREPLAELLVKPLIKLCAELLVEPLIKLRAELRAEL